MCDNFKSALQADPIGGGSVPVLDKYVIEQLKEINPKTVVDFGAGKGKYGSMIKGLFDTSQCSVTAVEGFLPTAEYLREVKLYDSVENMRIQEWLDKNNTTYDLAIFGDVLEHLEKREVRKVLKKVKKFFNHIIICVPLRNIFQEDLYDNTLEIHKAYLDERSFDNYYIREKHIVMADRNMTKMSVWIENYPINRFKRFIIDFVCIVFGWRVIYWIKKITTRLGIYEDIKKILKQN